MKFVIAAAAVTALLSLNVFAAEKNTNICDRFMTCGTYIEPIKKDDPDSVETKITITSTGPMTGSFDFTQTDAKGNSHTWPLQATFDDGGAAVMRWEGKEVYAVAICKHGFCNYALVPFQAGKDQTKIWGNAGLMRFTGTTLEFMMTAGTPTEFKSRARVMPKQK